MNRLGLKIGCLVVSVVIWIQVASTSVVQQVIEVPLRVTGLAPGLTTEGSDLPQDVSLRVQGSKLRLIRHKYFSAFVGEVRLDLSGRGAGSVFPYDVAAQDIFSDLDDAEVFPPLRLQVHIDREVSRTLPVSLALSGELPAAKGLLAGPRVVPDSVRVRGPQRFFDVPLAVRTLPANLGKVTGASNLEVALEAPPPHLTFEPDRVRVTFQVGDLEERTLANIPVIALVDAGRPEVGVSPPVADLMVRGVGDSLRTLSRDRFLVTIPVGDLPSGVYTLPGQVDCPSWLTLIRINPSEFKVIVGNPPSAAGKEPGKQPDNAAGEGSGG